jgi:hypothetical protein
MSLAIDPEYQVDPAQVGQINVFQDPNFAPNHLTNNIHLIWAYRNWSRNMRVKNTPKVDGKKYRRKRPKQFSRREHCNKLPAHVYERIRPALRLSSLFLEKSLPWFWNVRYAPSRFFGHPKRSELLLDEGEWTSAKENQIRRDLNLIAQRYFILHGLHSWELHGAGISSSVRANLDADVPEDPDEDEYVIYWQNKEHLLTIIAKETIEFVGSRQWLDLPLPIQHRCLFQFAILMVHELAHIVNFYRHEDALRNNEPYFRRTEPTRELGFSWEYYMFGGLIAVVDGEFRGVKLDDEDAQVIKTLENWPYHFSTHVQLFCDWKHPKHRIDDLNHPPARWLVASRSIEQFFDMRRWNQWLAMPIKHGPMDYSPFAVHLSPSLFMSLLHESSFSYDVWYFRRLHRAAGLVWPNVTNYESHYTDTDWSQPSSPD